MNNSSIWKLFKEKRNRSSNNNINNGKKIIFRLLNNLNNNGINMMYIHNYLINNNNNNNSLKKLEESSKNSVYINVNMNKDKEYMINLQKKYFYYYLSRKQLDNIKDKGINYFDSNNNNIKDNYINNNHKIKAKNIKMMKLFKKEDRKNKESKLSFFKKNIYNNIIESRYNSVINRKVTTNLLNPYYFFTPRYNEKSKPTQVKQWRSSMYNFENSGRWGINFLDIYTSKLINLYFRVKYIKRKLAWNVKLIEGLKVVPSSSILQDINTVIKYTSSRTRSALKKMKTFSPLFLTLDWVKKQIKSSTRLSKMIKHVRTGLLSGYYPRNKEHIKKLSRVLLSKPLFKHTSFNLIIDLFLYNNKGYKLGILKNLTVRRTTYKYLYSMYINSYDKIKDTINKPRYFYMNLITPNIYNYYKWITLYYELLLVKKNKFLFTYICLLVLQLNFVKKIKLNTIKNEIVKKFDIIKNKYKKNNNLIDINKINNNLVINKEEQINHYIDRIVRVNKYSKKYLYNLFFNKKRKALKFYNLDKLVVKNTKNELDINDNKKEKKDIKNRKSKYLLYKKYIEELNRKSNNPIDINDLTLWNREGMRGSYYTPTGLVTNIKQWRKKKKKGFIFNVKIEKKEQEKIIKGIFKEKLSLKKKIKKLKLFKAENTRKFMKKFNLNSYEELSLFKKNKLITDSKKRLEMGLDKFIEEKYNFFRDNNKMRTNYLNRMKKFKNINKNKKMNINMNINNNINTINMNINNDNNLKLLRQQVNNNIIDKSSLNKEDYIKEKYLNKNINNNFVNKVFSSFYINNINNKNFYSKIFSKDESLLFNKNKINNKRNINPILIIKKEENLNNSKILWDNLDYSIFQLLSKHLNLSRKGLDILPSQLNSLFNKFNKLKGYNNVWYIFYFLSVIKKEFYIINRDVLLTKEIQIIPYSNNIMKSSYYFNSNLENNILSYVYGKENIDINLWPLLYSNKRENNLDWKLGYNEKLFKPYYRYLIPYFIFNSYKNFSSSIGLNKLLFLDKKNIFKDKNYIMNKLNIFRNNNFILYNFLTVKILLDLLHYNYRSLMKIKIKYYYINKLRLYANKLNRLSINNWVTSFRFIRKLRKTPMNYWLRYHKLGLYYINRIIQNAELDTQRKIFVPFVIYFEDLLFNIYGKWVLIRLWPLKRYFLSSFILAGRVLLLILWRNKQKMRWLNFRRITSKLITGIKLLQIKKAYNFYINNSNPWPAQLINIMKDKQSFQILNYNNLEFENIKEDRSHFLNTYLSDNKELYSYLSPLNNNYGSDFIKNIKFKLNESHFNKNYSVVYPKINNLEFVYYWLRPLKNYILKLNQSFDISGIKFRISGRGGIRRNNLRSTYKNISYGSFLGPRHTTTKFNLPKTITISTPKIRGYLKTHIDYGLKTSKSMNGSLTLKIWISSEISADLHELLLHLVKIKYLYNELINRYYIINPYLNRFRYNYPLLPLDKIIPFSKRKISNRKISKRKISIRKKK
jgi:hypothetical protein